MSAPWLIEARKHVGTSEIVGKQHSPAILNWLRGLRAWWQDDETPWCGVFVAHCLRVVGCPFPKAWFRARAYLDFGVKIDKPCVGCLAIFTRTGGGHVAFVVGYDKQRRLMCLGGNQGNSVTIAPFDVSRVAGYVWPDARFAMPKSSMPILDASRMMSSQNEA
jgi:uncharacterized protein (TIGR02594 family)